MAKTISDPSFSGSGVDLSDATTYFDAITNSGGTNEIRTQIWSELVTRDAREKNVFAKFIGSEGSGKPIVEKTNLSAGGSDRVTFTSVAPIRGQGVRGETVLKHNTGDLSFGTFKVEVDLIRHAVSWTQVLKLMRFTGKTLDQLSAQVMSEWAARTEQDHLQMCLRDTCLNVGGNNILNGYGTATTGSIGALEYTDGLSTDIIQEAKQQLIANGAQPMNTGGDVNQDIPGYLFFAPDAVLRPLRSDPDYLEAITQADARSAENKLYSGSYAKWDNNIIANHNIIIDTAQGRQGSPLAAVQRVPIADDTVLVAAGFDAENTDLNKTAVPGDGLSYGGAGQDFWSNFVGATVEIPGGGGASYETSDVAHVLIVDQSGNYVAHAVEAIGSTCTIGPVTGSTGIASYLELGNAVGGGILGGQGTLETTDVWTFYPCNAVGTPIGYILAMGESALYYAKGAVTNEQIFHYDDFANSGNDAHLSAVGVQSVYGMGAYQDSSARIPGVVLIEAVRQVPGLSLGSQA